MVDGESITIGQLFRGSEGFVVARKRVMIVERRDPGVNGVSTTNGGADWKLLRKNGEELSFLEVLLN
jgi:hypothetical protein